MVRARLWVMIGAVVAVFGLCIASTALLWLGANWGFGTHTYDSEGVLYKYFSAARFGLSAGIVALLVGLGIVIGFAARARAK